MKFFKTNDGDYSSEDEFLGIAVPDLRTIAKDFNNLSLKEIKILLESRFNEERLLALLILIAQYSKASKDLKKEIYHFYMDNLSHVNNWNLVDSSSHYILGAYQYNFDRDFNVFIKLARSTALWEKRIAIVSTWYFIRNNDLKLPLQVAVILLNDHHDLIHKAVGWMLREVGKRDLSQLIAFLDKYKTQMPRTMLRYSIEKFPEPLRISYLKSK